MTTIDYTSAQRVPISAKLPRALIVAIDDEAAKHTMPSGETMTRTEFIELACRHLLSCGIDEAVTNAD